MYRRFVVRSCGLLVMGGGAGCLDVGSETASDGSDGSDEEGDGSEREENGSNEEEPEIETAFEIHAVECGSGEDHTEITTEIGTVVVDGVIGGQNGCYSAELSAVSIAEETLLIEIESYEDSEDELCTQCLTDVAYEVRITIDGRDPSRIVVEHDGSNVGSADLR